MAIDLTALLADLRAETDDLLGVIQRAGPVGPALAAPTPAIPWTVGDQIGHLWFFDREAARAATDPEEFTAGLGELLADVDGYMNQAVETARGFGDGIVDAWGTEREAMIEALAGADPAAKLPWYGPPMSPASSATARLMETWAHGQDVADGLGVDRKPTDRLRHICYLGYRTRGFSYSVRGMPNPDGEVFVQLTPPDGGEPWSFGSSEARDRISGPAADFALLVTQRRLPADLDLEITGALAIEWASIAQIFAGMPTVTDPARAGL